MTYHPSYRTNQIFVTACLALACVTGTAGGCGSSDGGAPRVDSDLLGIYEVDQFQSSPECGELMDAEGAPRLVLYSALRADTQEAILVGEFCGSVDDCMARAEQSDAAVNYSFFEGSDAQGWEGYGIASQGMVVEQCQAEVQVHTLTAPNAQSVRIDTRQVETTYKANIDDTVMPPVATCEVSDAIDSITEESPCTALFLVEATFETGL